MLSRRLDQLAQSIAPLLSKAKSLFTWYVITAELSETYDLVGRHFYGRHLFD